MATIVPLLFGLLLFRGACGSGSRARPRNPDPHFPAFHVRPPGGHVNDPNGPFFDPVHRVYHLFMQYRSYTPAPNHRGIEWAHFGYVSDARSCRVPGLAKLEPRPWPLVAFDI